MSMKIERLQVKNDKRDNSTKLATFSVGFGAITLNGFELIKTNDGNVFMSSPNRRYEASPGNWKRYNYVWFEEGKGQAIAAEIQKLATEEYERRNGPVVEDGDNGVQPDPFAPDEDDLPF